MKPSADNTKTKGVKDLQATVDLDSITLQEAIDGLQVLRDIESDHAAREAYVEAVHKRWPEATLFQASD